MGLDPLVYLDSFAGLSVDAGVLHDGDVQLMQDTQDDPLPLGGTHCVVVSLDVDEDLQPVGQAVLAERHHGSTKMTWF